MVGADIWDSDGILPDDHLGHITALAPFETGWRREVSVYLTGSDVRILVTFELRPI